MKPFELKLGEQRLVVSDDGFTIPQIRKLVADLEEDRENYLNHISTSVDKILELNKSYDLEKKDSETEEEYKERMEKVNKDRKEKAQAIVGEDGLDSLVPLAVSVLKRIAAISNQEHKVTKEAVESVPWVKTKDFIYRVLHYNDIRFADVFKSDSD